MSNETARASAAKFDRIRQAHQSEVAEDYVEMIAELIAETGEARTVDLAARFGVTSPTVNAIIQRLKRENLVETRPYRSIFLTEAGKTMAHQAEERHKVADFLVTIGVPAPIAEEMPKVLNTMSVPKPSQYLRVLSNRAGLTNRRWWRALHRDEYSKPLTVVADLDIAFYRIALPDYAANRCRLALLTTPERGRLAEVQL